MEQKGEWRRLRWLNVLSRRKKTCVFEVVEWYKYTCDGILVSVIGLIGIIGDSVSTSYQWYHCRCCCCFHHNQHPSHHNHSPGNICAVLVLVRPKLKDCFHQVGLRKSSVMIHKQKGLETWERTLMLILRWLLFTVKVILVDVVTKWHGDWKCSILG